MILAELILGAVTAILMIISARLIFFWLYVVIPLRVVITAYAATATSHPRLYARGLVSDVATDIICDENDTAGHAICWLIRNFALGIALISIVFLVSLSVNVWLCLSFCRRGRLSSTTKLPVRSYR